MANQFDADILYEYLVLGYAQTRIAQEHGITQSEVSKLIRAYHLNEGNVAYGNGDCNQRGRYSNVSYDTICDFIDSGAYSFDEWLGGGDEYYDDGEYYEADEEYYDGEEAYYEEPDNSGYNESYNSPQQPQYRNGRKVTYVNVDEIEDDGEPLYRNGRKVTYVNPDDYDDDGNYIGGGGAGSSKGRMMLIIIALIIFGGSWLIKKYSDSSVIVASLIVLWRTKYLLYGLLPGVIFGLLKYFSCRSLREVLSTCGTWTWTALGLIVSGIAFFAKFSGADSGAALAAAFVMIIPGALIGFIGYKLFYR